MKNKKVYYFLVLALIFAALSAVFIIGVSGRRRGQGPKNALLHVERVEGDVSILRNGVAYILKEGVSLREDDSVVTGTDASCRLIFNGGTLLTVDADSQISFASLETDGSLVNVLEGAVIFETAGEESLPLRIMADTAVVEAGADELLMMEFYHGTATASIFVGTPGLSFEEREYTLVPGDRVVLVRGDDDAELFFNRILSSDLREFALRKLIEKGGVIFEAEQLEAVLEKRRAETAQVALPYEGEGLHCTLEIRCDTVLDHLDMLPPEKAAAIPADGLLLPATQVTFSRGDSVYDVLRRTCLSRGLEIDYDYAIKYTGYYVDHLAGLAEFELGPQSGWMYKVNGWFPNYGSAKYYVADGDVIVWLYTCEGLGTDVGVETWKDAEERGRSAGG